MTVARSHVWSIVAGLLLVLVVVGVSAGIWLSQQQTVAKPALVKSGVDMVGVLSCLPKQGSGPQTLECAYGLRVDDKYYALDMTNAPDQNLFGYTFDDKLKVSGDLYNVVPGSTYAISGTLKVTKIEAVKVAS